MPMIAWAVPSLLRRVIPGISYIALYRRTPALSALKKPEDNSGSPEQPLPLPPSVYFLVHSDIDPGHHDLGPLFHPGMGRVLVSFEPVWLGDATGRGAERPCSSSAPARCIRMALSLA